jgi:hypothetical protein
MPAVSWVLGNWALGDRDWALGIGASTIYQLLCVNCQFSRVVVNYITLLHLLIAQFPNARLRRIWNTRSPHIRLSALYVTTAFSVR